MKKFMAVLAILLILMILVMAGTLFGVFYVSRLDTNFPNLSIGGIAVGTLTQDETVKALESAGWEERMTVPLTVTTLGGQSFAVDQAEAGVAADAEQTAAYVHRYGRDSGMIQNFRTFLDCLLHPTELSMIFGEANLDYIRSCVEQNQADLTALLGDAEYVPDYENEQLLLRKGWGQLQLDEAGLTDAIVDALKHGETELNYRRLSKDLVAPDFDAIHTALMQEPRDAAFTDDGRFEVIDEVVGCRFDVAEARERWEEAAPTEEVVIPMSVTWPAVTGDMLRSSLYRDLLGACTTSYWNSAPNRITNVELASSKINGMILYPGDEFSYNTVVGARTTEAGFLPAPAYVDGEVQDEIGGGACQVSSTLYAATVFAFLETVERTNHYFPVHYMQLGTDATVTIPEGGNAIDFKFRNSKSHPIKLVAYSTVDEDNYVRDLTFEIWGTLEDGDYMPVEFDNSWGWSMIYDRVIEPADPNRPGYKIKLTHEQWYYTDAVGEGTATLTHREVYDTAGNLVEDQEINAFLPNGQRALDVYYDHNE